MSRNGVELHELFDGRDQCKHCEHLTAYWEDTAGEHKRWQCCHCGRIRDEYAPIGAVWEIDAEFEPTSRYEQGERHEVSP